MSGQVTLSVPIDVEDDSIVIQGVVNGKPVEFILDTGDAIGPVFNAQDAERAGLQQGQVIGVSGAGGATINYATVADITFDSETWTNEPGSIDTSLQGPSLLGLPFFLREAAWLTFDFQRKNLTIQAIK